MENILFAWFGCTRLQSHADARTALHAQLTLRIVCRQCIQRRNGEHKECDKHGVQRWTVVAACDFVTEQQTNRS